MKLFQFIWGMGRRTEIKICPTVCRYPGTLFSFLVPLTPALRATLLPPLPITPPPLLHPCMQVKEQKAQQGASQSLSITTTPFQRDSDVDKGFLSPITQKLPNLLFPSFSEMLTFCPVLNKTLCLQLRFHIFPKSNKSVVLWGGG